MGYFLDRLWASTRLSRRDWWKTAGLLTAATAAGGWLWPPRETLAFLSAADKNGQHCLVGLNRLGQVLFEIVVPWRAHDSIMLNDRLAVFFARRPGRVGYVVDTQQGQLIGELNAIAEHHFCGHGVVDAQHQHLYVSEYAYERQMGVIGVYEAQPPFKRVAQMDTGGLDPHQLQWMPDQKTLVIANGGILTHPSSERENLAPDKMAPSLVYLNSQTGQALQSVTPPHPQISLRHLSVTLDGTVIVAAQDHSTGLDRPNPLVFSHRLDGALTAMQALDAEWQAHRQYIASVVVNSQGSLAATTSPKGPCVSLWDIERQRLLGHWVMPDVAGAVWSNSAQSFILTNGFGQIAKLQLKTKPMLEPWLTHTSLYWDNHLHSLG